MQRILFVCLGNICRSPTAEGVFRVLAAKAGLRVQVDSAGTGGWHAGEPPHPPAVAAARKRGYDLSSLRARQVRAGDFSGFDLILAMDRQNLADLQAMADGPARLRLLMHYAPEGHPAEVPDPWYTGEFDRVLLMIEAASRGLIRELQRQTADQPPQ
ncbi:low molecular weight protein-tyrosine-phosphatase [Neotabrizicola sp. VNH66]|uniref:low molecular weight protein-tyrosine-phosphatase n=1 Tax=Neotabrizicola sp. VNH66 TaxID=3400918 RepID=UPI003C0A8B62